MTISTNITPFYNKDLEKVQKHAKKLASHPILSNVEHIKTQLNHLRLKHIDYIQSCLVQKYGELKGRELAQAEAVRELVDSFEDIDTNTARELEKQAQNISSTQLVPKLRRSFFHQEKKAQEIRKEVIKSLKETLPDLVKIPIKRRILETAQ